MDNEGTFIWHELLTTDLDAAARFYGDVVGWKVADSGMPGPMRYLVCSVEGRGVAGLMTMPPHLRDSGVGPHWSGYIRADDVDSTTVKMKAAGASVHREAMDIPNVGRFSVVSDPEGAAFNIFKPKLPQDAPVPPAPAPGTPGVIGWNELMSTDAERAWEFYAAQLGWQETAAHEMGPMGTYRVFRSKNGSADMGGMMTIPHGLRERMPHSFWRFYFNVDDIQAGKERVERAGGSVTHGPVEVPGGQWIVQGVDPQGGHFALVAPGA